MDKLKQLKDRLGELEVMKKTSIKEFYEEYDSVVEEIAKVVPTGVAFQARNGVVMKLEPCTVIPVFVKHYTVKRTKCTEDDVNTLAAKTAQEEGFSPAIPNVRYKITEVIDE